MEKQLKKYSLIFGTAVFIVLPILFYIQGDFPRRSILKESLSVLTILAFFMMLAQFYLARSNKKTIKAFKMSEVIKVHKFIGYLFVAVLFMHPFMIVFPRYFEAGVSPMDALYTLLFDYGNTGVLFGIIAWVLMLIIGITSIFRNKLGIKYNTWRYLHGLISILFIALASIHVIKLGRHANFSISLLIITLSSIGIYLLLKTYILNFSKKKGEK